MKSCQSTERNAAHIPRQLDKCLRLSDDTLKAVSLSPFYLVSMPGEVKYPVQGVNV